MTELARCSHNPIIMPADVPLSQPGLSVVGVLNPAATMYRGEILLLMRVAEMPLQESGNLRVAVLDEDCAAPYALQFIDIPRESPKVETGDPRVIRFESRTYLTSISHLRLARSRDGIHFEIDREPTIPPEGSLEAYGIEDARITRIEDTYYINYTAASCHGIATSLITTRDWKTFTRRGVIFHPQNKDVVISPAQVDGRYVAMHRPAAQEFEDPSIWLARSPDLLHWGDHSHLISPRPGYWDAARIGAGAPPVLTSDGWLSIYHGVSAEGHYALGALLLDADDPSRVVARSDEPILLPDAAYERHGFYANTVFCNGMVADESNPDRLLIYYGAADRCIAMAEGSVVAILQTLRAVAV